MCGHSVWIFQHFFVIMMLQSSEAYAVISTQPYDETMCAGADALFTCGVNRNGSSIVDVRWEQLISGSSSFMTIPRTHPFSVTTTISGDVLTSRLTITNVTTTLAGLYRCVEPVSGVASISATLRVGAGPPDPPMNIRFKDITTTSFVVQWDEVDDADRYFVNWRSGHGVAREAITSRTSRSVRGLTPDTTYLVTIIPYNGCLGDSAALTITTIVSRPSTPSSSLPSSSSSSLPPSSSSSLPPSSSSSLPPSSSSSLPPSSSSSTFSPSPSSSPSTSLSPMIFATSIELSILSVSPTAGSSSGPSTDPGAPLVVIFPIIAIIVVVGITLVIVVVTFLIVKKKANYSINTAHKGLENESTLTRDGYKNPLYDNSDQASHKKHLCGLYETLSPPSHAAEDMKLQPNPAYSTSDKVVMDNNPAYQLLK